jgi:dihydropyrimidinase
MRSLVKGGQIVTAVQTYFADVLIEDERIAATGFFDPQSVDRVIDATGKLVLLGGVDPHTRLDARSRGQRPRTTFLDS